MISIDEAIQNDFIFHANQEAPREACGLVAVIKGKQRYYHCKNSSLIDDEFAIIPSDLIEVEDMVESHAGDIVAILHSHPKTSELPSMADLAGCEQSGLLWAIYSLKTSSWHSFVPTGYRAPLIGRKFKHGVFDCYSALRDWYAEKNIFLPNFEREEYWWEKGQNLLVDNIERAGFKEISPSDIQAGDTILVTVASSVVNHCAVYIGNDQVYHQTMNRLSSREIYGGQLKKNTRMVLRYSK